MTLSKRGSVHLRETESHPKVEQSDLFLILKTNKCKNKGINTLVMLLSERFSLFSNIIIIFPCFPC